MKLNISTYRLGNIALLAFIALTVLFGFTRVIFTSQYAPQHHIQQFNTISNSHSFSLSHEKEFHQELQIPSPWSAIGIRFLPNKNTAAGANTTLSIKQGDTQLTKVTIPAVPMDKNTVVAGTDFFMNDDWLFFPIPQIEQEYNNVAMTLGIDKGKITLPYDKNLTGNIQYVGLVKTSLPQRFAWALLQKHTIRNVATMLTSALALLCIWQLMYIKEPPARKRSIGLFFLLGCIVYILPLFANSNFGGKNDWTEVVAHFASARHTFALGQFPLWNPYFCGGFPAWSNPQTYWPSFIFLLSLLTNDIIGTKLAIGAYLFVALIGMYAFARSLQISVAGALVASIIYAGNGFIALHISDGHILWLTMAWIPWVMYFLIKSIQRPLFIVVSSLALLLIILEGQVYFAIYTALFMGLFSIAWWAHTGSNVIIRRVAVQYAITACVGAIKLIPTLFFLRAITGHFGEGGYLPISSLFPALLERNIMTINTEYDAYVGIVALGLFAVGVIYSVYKRNRLYASMAGITVIFILFAIIPPEINLLRSIPIIRDLRSQTRALSIVMFTIAIGAGFGLQTILQTIRSVRRKHLLAIACIAWLSIDYLLVSRPALQTLFTIPPSGLPSYAGYIQTSGRADTTYSLTEAGMGNINYCPPHMRLWQPRTASVLAKSDQAYKGEVYTDNNSNVRMTKFTPNEITLKTGTITTADIVHINQNNDLGWHSTQIPLSHELSHISFPISANDSNKIIVVTYTPRGFVLGKIITIFSLALISIYTIVKFK